MNEQTIDTLGLSAELMRGIRDLGFESPTPVQAKVIPLLLDKPVDLVALAQTGTGKTAAFGLPIIQGIDITNRRTQALILSPTRELCMQIARDLNDYCRYVDGLRVQPVYGGADIQRQITALQKGVHIIVATPGRMLDLIKRRRADISGIQTVVLDEADEMLNMGFKEDLNAILAKTPSDKNTLLFSATMPAEATRISRDYMDNPVKITIGQRNSGAENVSHHYYMVQAKNRYAALKRIADINTDIYGIIFCRTRKETKEIADKLMQDGYNADALHGDLSQSQRDAVMQKFRQKSLQMLVATDVAARGLDVNDLTHVINMGLPDDNESYTHRSGRTGRAGKSGVSISIIHSHEKGRLRMIEKKINKTFEYRPVPNGKDICETQLFHLIDKMKSVAINDKEISPYLEKIHQKLDGLDRDEIIKRFVSLEFNRFLEYYKNAGDLNYKERGRRERPQRPERYQRSERSTGTGRSGRMERRSGGQSSFTRFHIDVGSKDNLSTGSLIGFINRISRNRDMRIGKIEILKSFSFFEVEDAYAQDIVDSFHSAKFDGKKVRVDLAESSSGHPRRDRSKGKGNFSRKKYSHK